MFFDGANFAKSGKNGSIWAMFSMIIDLPPYLRIKFQNILTHYLIGCSNPNINKFNKIYSQTLDDLTSNGIQIMNKVFKIKISGTYF